ncbi:uncharacterized protein PHACADRAFT_262148 [Phanerochaete carnosa HHB-10118-sp]|uniref:Uncharacterized protein n=1 Tax=Phanerochaete carnosa (strain HHB-10118-sp) TaxID=650164 RepID=K5UPU5_PHACS|nr:uncharacterized protein PHACADRAFT_262148 [Phanerochaete carnosa HHB-10118-sp]EKM51806.1 hypothetical protein PHACADRAFT_262148 [Phanerochaete carnosa HHB-10118-sp]
MTDAADAGIIAGGLCCICCTESLEQWCLFNNAWGSGSGDGHQAGCCTRCCKRSFDKDEFADQQDRPQQPREAGLRQGQAVPNGQPSGQSEQQKQDGADIVHKQPAARKSMEVPRIEAAEQPKPE